MGVSRPACSGLSDVDAFLLGVVKIKIEKKRFTSYYAFRTVLVLVVEASEPMRLTNSQFVALRRLSLGYERPHAKWRGKRPVASSNCV